MKLTTRCRYGARAIIEIAKNYEIGPTKRKDISKNQKIPESFLENILIDLKQAGVIRSVRGCRGGFVMNRPPSQVTMYEIFDVLNGLLVPVACIKTPDICEFSNGCFTRPIWMELYEAQENILKKHSIKELIDRQIKHL